jgi:hypothetical protein
MGRWVVREHSRAARRIVNAAADGRIETRDIVAESARDDTRAERTDTSNSDDNKKGDGTAAATTTSTTTTTTKQHGATVPGTATQRLVKQ